MLKRKKAEIPIGPAIPALLRPIYAEDFSRLVKGPLRIRLTRSRRDVLH